MAQVISVEERYVHALEAVFHQDLQDILVNTSDEAMEMINELKAGRKGKGGFVLKTLEVKGSRQSIPHNIMELRGFIGRMEDFVGCEEEYQTLVKWILADYLLVKDLESGMAVAGELDDDRWAIVAYIRALQYSQNVNVNDLPAETRQEIESQLE